MRFPKTLTTDSNVLTIDTAETEWDVLGNDPPPYTPTFHSATETRGAVVTMQFQRGLQPPPRPKRWLTFPACALSRLINASIRGLVLLHGALVRVAIREGFVTETPPKAC